MRALLDDVAKRNLPGALARALHAVAPASDESVWFIRSLDIDFAVNAEWSQDRLGTAWADALARTIAAELAQGEHAECVVRFASPAAYRARFLADLALGAAWSRWYYRPFEGLRMLPISAALRTAICEEAGSGLAALLEMSGSERAAVLAALTLADLRRVLSVVVGSDRASSDSACADALWAVWRPGVRRLAGAADELREVVEMCVRARGGAPPVFGPAHAASTGARAPAVGGPALRELALALVRLARLFSEGTLSHARRLGDALIGRDPAILYRCVGAADAETVAPLLRCSPEWLAEVVTSLLALHGPARRPSTRRGGADERRTRADGHTEPLHGAFRSTPFGGAFYLLPSIDALPLDAATVGWPPAGDMPAAAVTRFAALVRCLGAHNFVAAFYDPLLRDLLEIDPALDLSAFTRWRRAAAVAAPGTLEAVLREAGRDGGSMAYRHVVVQPVGTAGRVVLIDSARGLWMRLATCRSPAQLVPSLDALLAEADGQHAVAIAPDAWMTALSPLQARHAVISLTGADAAQFLQQDDALTEVVARLPMLPDELAYLRLRGRAADASAVGCAIAIAAQHILRGLAWRLPGFGYSTLPHLFRNFLDFPATVEDEAGRVVVRTGRAPLHLILSMTGIPRATYTLSWLDNIRFELFDS